MPVIPYAAACLPPAVGAAPAGADVVGAPAGADGAPGVGNGRGVAPVDAQAHDKTVSAITKLHQPGRLIGAIELSAKIAQAVWSRPCFSTPRTSP